MKIDIKLKSCEQPQTADLVDPGGRAARCPLILLSLFKKTPAVTACLDDFGCLKRRPLLSACGLKAAQCGGFPMGFVEGISFKGAGLVERPKRNADSGLRFDARRLPAPPLPGVVSIRRQGIPDYSPHPPPLASKNEFHSRRHY